MMILTPIPARPCIRKNLGHGYEICVSGGLGDDGKVGGDVTIQREGGGVVSIKRDGKQREKTGWPVTYWRGGIECPDAQPLRLSPRF